jgi:hypothetical protein
VSIVDRSGAVMFDDLMAAASALYAVVRTVLCWDVGELV